MDPKHLTAVIVSAILGVILLVTVVAPIVSDGQTTTGDPITLTNDSPIVLREIKNGDVLECVRTVTDGTATDLWTLNGEAVVGPTGSADTWNVGLMSDGLYLSVNAASNAAVGSWYAMDDTTPSASYLSGGGSNGAHYGIVAMDGAISVYGAYGSESQVTITTKNYTWGYVVCPYGEGEYCAPIAGGVGIVKDPNQVILCGAYTTGDFDTMYYYKDGQTYVSNTAYTMTANITTAVHTGTTDIYDATVSVGMTDGTDTETYTPYRILVPYEVAGHATSGSLYSMLGVIPIVVAIGIVLGVVSMAIVNRYD